jgi:hypothetical protein
VTTNTTSSAQWPRVKYQVRAISEHLL